MAVYGWIGLGNMGGPMTSNIVNAGHTVRGFDLSQRAQQLAREGGVEVVGSIKDAVSEADVVFTSLPKGDHVRSVFDGPDGIWAHAPKTALLADASTVDIATSRFCHEESAKRGYTFIDAPVSGGISGAAAGTLTFMLGGEPEAVSRGQEFVAPMAGNVIAVGGATSGIAAKIVNNMMLFINLVGVAEGSQLAESLGLDAQTFWSIANTSSAESWAQRTWYPLPGIVDSAAANNNFDATFTAELALKDVSLALEAGAETGVNLDAAQLAAQQFQKLIDEGLGKKDCSLIAKLSSPDGTVRGYNPSAD
ncbi:3-hydroxyisobutyrate dehydrogenase [Neomicrococcus lactis]|uniref:3-hydroxyisobutyrate dehydrogenase n=1 Tax=Neomicrococcus lactis TaxID=732241 RepID=UPI0022FFE033|nr:3-hydroxyisobutyrate dehydrogenase [Neomicrococcus lactis]